MGATKSHEFTLKENKQAKYAKALGHPARLAIIKLLISKQTCICGDIEDELPLSQSTVSQHLKELKEADLIKGEIEGAKFCYCINDNSFRSQMGEGYFKFFGNNKVAVYSAGIETHDVNEKAIAVMKQDGVDISKNTSNNVEEYRKIDF